MTTKDANEIIKRGAILLGASFVSVALFWIAYGSICERIDLRMASFEREPALGWDHWRWFFIKQDIGGVLRTLAIPTAFAMVVTWKWIAFARDSAAGNLAAGKSGNGR